MSQLSTKLDICNLALSKLNQEPISSIEAPSKTAKQLKLHYDNIRRECLRKHIWNFAIERDLLPELATAPAFEYSNAFKLPNNFVRLCSLGTAGEITDYQVENYKILVNQSGPLAIKYISDFTEVRDMDALFVTYFSTRLAAELAYPITGSVELKTSLYKEAETILTWATAIDGQERPPVRVERSRTLEARHSMGSRGYSTGKLR